MPGKGPFALRCQPVQLTSRVSFYRPALDKSLVLHSAQEPADRLFPRLDFDDEVRRRLLGSGESTQDLALQRLRFLNFANGATPT